MDDRTGGTQQGQRAVVDRQAEIDVLRAMARWDVHRSLAVELLTAGDFAGELHAVLFDVLSRFDNTGRQTPAEVVAVLQDEGILEDCGGEHRVLEIMDGAASQPLRKAVQAVSDASCRRQLTHVVDQITDGLAEADTDPSLLIDAAAEALNRIRIPLAKDPGPAVLQELLQPALDEIAAAGEAGAELPGEATGFADLDRLLNGLQPGHLIVIGGRPGSGKSTLALDMLRHATLHNDHPAALFTRESSKTEVVHKLLAAETRVPLHVLRSGNLSDNDWTRLAKRMGDISQAPLFVDNRVNSIDELRAKTRMLKNRYGLRLVVVENIQRFHEGRWDRYREAAGISRMLKDLAMDIEVPVVAVSELNRNLESRVDKRPILADLRDTGTIEEDADVVIFVHRDDLYDKESPRAGEADLMVAKHRNGATDVITVAAQLHLSRFVDMAI